MPRMTPVPSNAQLRMINTVTRIHCFSQNLTIDFSTSSSLGIFFRKLEIKNPFSVPLRCIFHSPGIYFSRSHPFEMKSSGKGGLLCPVSSEQEPNFAQHQLVNTDALITSTNTTSSPSPPLQCPSVLVLQHSPALKKPLTFCFSGVELSLYASFPYCTSIMPSLTSIQLYFSLTVLPENGQK